VYPQIFATCASRIPLRSLIIAFLLVCLGLNAGLIGPAYAHETSAYSNENTTGLLLTDWMTALPDELLLSELSIPGTHDSGAYLVGGSSTETQKMDIGAQLDAGIRFLDLRVGQTPACPLNIFHNGICQNGLSWQDVVDYIVAFLAAHPGETVIARVKNEYGDPSFDDVKAALGSHYYGASSSSGETKTNPTLGELRGRIFVLAESWLIPDSDPEDYYKIGPRKWSCPTSCQDHWLISSIWDLEEKWKDFVVPNFIEADKVRGADSDKREQLYINFLSAYPVGSYPYFTASGHSSWGTSDPRLLTGWTRGLIDTCSSNDQCIPEYPSVNCIDFFGVEGSETCSVAFEGINVLARNYILNKVRDRVGIVVADFPGAGLIKAIVDLNPYKIPVVADAGPRGLWGPDEYNVVEGSWIELIPGRDMKGTGLSWRWDFNNDGDWDTDYLTDLFPGPVIEKEDDFHGVVTIEVKDEFGVTDKDSAWISFYNHSPFVNTLIGSSYQEGELATVSGMILDLGADQQRIQIDWTGDGALEVDTLLPSGSTAPCPPPLEGWYCTPFSENFLFTDGGQHDRMIRVIDDDGGAQQVTKTITIQNVPPKVTSFTVTESGGSNVVGENDQIAVGTQVDIYVEFTAQGDDTYSATIDFGDGNNQSLPSQFNHEFETSHTYSTPGDMNARILITDDDGKQCIGWSVPFRVGDPPPPPVTLPTAHLTGPYSADEGGTIVADASGSTVDASKTANYRWDFDGDGVWDTGRSADPVSPPWPGPDPLQPDDYSGILKVEVWDGTNAAVAQTTVEFTNVSPTLVANAMVVGLGEGDTETFELFIIDPGHDVFTLVVDWNNYSDEDEQDYYYLAPGETEIYISHVYRDNPPGQPFGSYQVRFDIIDDEGGSSFTTEPVEVVNQIPQITIAGVYNHKGERLGPAPLGNSETMLVGTAARLFVNWEDQGLDDTHEALIEWGDGSSTPLANPDPVIDVSHIYETFGTYQIKVTITDNDGFDDLRFSQPFTVNDVFLEDGFEDPQE